LVFVFFSGYLPVFVVRVHLVSSPITQVHFALPPRWYPNIPVSNGKNYRMGVANTKNYRIVE
jgi:hypothetical protein